MGPPFSHCVRCRRALVLDALESPWTPDQPTEHGWYWFVPAAYWMTPNPGGDPLDFRDVIQVDHEGVRSVGAADLITWPLVGYFCRIPEPPELPAGEAR